MDEDAELQARAVLDAAIKAYCETVDSGVYVDAWVLLTHKLSADGEANDYSTVGTVAGVEQTFVTTRGLLEVGLDSVRHNSWAADE
ncbi:hypothetical protein [Gryllotalpicola koreensis]|uniref:Uncharacterized protein n=1 Tax=Gryllotalpicola koreensis TaxID=993086 RepID=A0ABP8A228_9MICO